MWPTRRPSTRSTSQGSAFASRDTSRRPSRSHHLPHTPSVLDIFPPPAPPKSIHVRSDPAYVASPVTAEFQYDDLRMPLVLAERSALHDGHPHDLARFESRTSTFVSATTGTTLFSNGSTAAFKPESAITSMPQMVNRPTQGTTASASSTWRVGACLARALGEFSRMAQRDNVPIEEPYKVVYEQALAVEREHAAACESLPCLDGHSVVGPITSEDCITPVTSEQATWWRGVTGMRVMHRKSDDDDDDGNSWRDEVYGCFPAFDALKGCFGGRER